MTDKHNNSAKGAENESARICLLNCIELCTIIFRGIRNTECSTILEDALPALATLSAESLQSLSVPVSALAGSCPAETDNFCSQLETEYVRLFINSREGVVAPLYESCYGPGFARTMGEPALAMRRLLEEAGLTPSGNMDSEPPDHLCIELEYLYVHLVQGWGSSDEESLRSARAFAGEMLVWTGKFRDKLASGGAMKFYVQAAALLVAVLEEVTSS
ncbi:TorD/DmsD family molecular chaperone [Maridesulfovibrio sp. FT414]|uniref:TorD/DmsD family molecular chaperone n=1 Tax=Maridesulfovibrio sp. FT414 TaxID=2979469 RepID=UPI003D80932F